MSAPTLSDNRSTSPSAAWLPVVCFAAIALLHGYLVSRNWDAGFLVGQEFRQTQTALSIHFIAADHDFRLAYPTPLFGPPWSVPLEFPLYQWAVAAGSELFDTPLASTARAITLACFYLTLPALYLLLRHWSISPTTRWWILSLILCLPLYVFYSRAVLIESMALMFSVWFLWAFQSTTKHPRIVRAIAVVLLGSLAALTKITTFSIWGLAALVTGLAWMIREHRLHGLRGALKALTWSIASGLPPLLVGLYWTRFADQVKALSPATRPFTSSGVQAFSLGTSADRFAQTTWRAWLDQAETTLSMPILLLGLLLASLVLPRAPRAQVLGCLLWLLIALMAFPRLFAVHDYYFYAIAILPLCGLAFALEALTQSARQRAIAASLVLLLCTVSLHGYWTGDYHRLQSIRDRGGNGLTDLIRELTPADESLIIMGQDWSAATAYYSQRRAMMIRDDIIKDDLQFEEHLGVMADAPVSALLVSGQNRAQTRQIAAITQRFDLDPQVTLRHRETDIYLSHNLRDTIMRQLIDFPNYRAVDIVGPLPPPPNPIALLIDQQVHPLSADQAKAGFFPFSPLPHQYRTQFGISISSIDGAMVVSAHPDAAIWIHPPPDSRTAWVTYGLPPQTYADSTSATDGVRFRLIAHAANGGEHVLLDHLLQPVVNPADRGLQSFEAELPKDTVDVELQTLPHQNYHLDWAYWGQVRIH